MAAGPPWLRLARACLAPCNESREARIFVPAVGVAMALVLFVRKRRAAAQAEGDDKAVKQAGSLGRIWKMILPNSLSGDGAGSIIAISLNSLFRVALEYITARMIQWRMQLLFSRDTSVWPFYFKLSVAVSFAHVTFHTLNQQLEQKLNRVLRRKMTTIAHDKYFARSNYYHLEQKMKDADVRLTEDITKLAEGFTQILSRATFTATNGVVFVASMLWEYGLGYALMPFAYLVLGKAIQEKFAPMDWNLFVKSETHKAKFRTSWTRVVTHSEAISALGGGQTERELLNRRFEGFTSMTATINRALVPFDACQRFMYMHGMGVIFFAFCVGPATFRPPSQATGAERIAENTELYGRVGYQFKMFEMLMITAWSMVNIWEQYKKLTGNGVRFNELLDTLDEIDAMDSANTNDRIVDGKIIEFKNVNVSVAALLSAPRSRQDAVRHRSSRRRRRSSCTISLSRSASGTACFSPGTTAPANPR